MAQNYSPYRNINFSLSVNSPTGKAPTFSRRIRRGITHYLRLPTSITPCSLYKWHRTQFAISRQLGRYLSFPRADPVAWRESQGLHGSAGQSRRPLAVAKSTKRIAFGADQPSAIRLPWLRFSVIFLSCKANAKVFNTKSGHGPQSPHPGAAASPKHLITSHAT